MGEIQYDQGAYSLALDQFQDSARLSTSHQIYRVHDRIAWCYYRLEQYSQAQLFAEMALEISPDHRPAVAVRGLALLNLNREEDGLLDIRRLERLGKPPDKVTLDALSENPIVRSLRDLDTTTLSSDKPQRQHTKGPITAYSMRWGSTRHLASVRSYFYASLLIVLIVGLMIGNPRNRLGLFSLGRAEHRTRSIVVVLYPNTSYPLFYRGLSHIWYGNYENAIADFQQASIIDPGFLSPCRNG